MENNVKQWIFISFLMLFLVGCEQEESSSDSSKQSATTSSTPSVSLNSNLTFVNMNGSVQLSWTTNAVVSCLASGDWSGIKASSGTETISSITSDKTFALNCSSSAGAVSDSIQITVVTGSMPAISISANPTSLPYNDSTTLTWSSTNATNCTASDDWSGSRGTSGTSIRSNLTEDKTYTLTCSGPGGSASDTVNITVSAPPAPTLSFTATPSTVSQNGSTTLEWDSTNTTSCTASGDWSGNKAVSDSQAFNSINSNKTYTLTCDGAGGSVNDTVNVTYNPVNTAPSADAGSDQAVSTGAQVTLNGAGSSDPENDPLTFAWTLTSTPSGSTAALSNSTSMTPTLVADMDGVYTASLVVNDGTTSSSADSVSVTASTGNPNQIYTRTLIPGVYDCNDAMVHCVDDNASANQEFSTIQQAVDVAGPSDVVLVHAGTYAGFSADNSGTQGNEILITGNGNNVVINGPNGRSGNDNIYIANASYVIIEGFTVINAVQYGIGSHDASANFPMQGVQVRYNTVDNSNSTNIYLSQTANSLVLANTTLNSQASHGIYVTNAGSDNVTLVGNLSYQNQVNGIHFNGDGSNGGDGVHRGLLVWDNVVYNNNANGIDGDGVYDSIFINNLIFGNGRHGIRIFRIDSNLGAGNLSFVNNTIVSNASMAIKLTDDTGGNLFFNNALVANSGGCIYVESTNLISDNNIFSSNCSFTPNNTSLFFGGASFTASTSQLFTNAGGNDYSLNATSPAIGAGLSSLNGTNAPATDIVGKTRDANVDIGAYEF